MMKRSKSLRSTGRAKTQRGVVKTKRTVAKSGFIHTKKAQAGAFKAAAPGFRQDRRRSGLFLPVSVSSVVVPPGKAKKGFADARRRIDEALDELSGTLVGFEVSEIEVQVSFSADGKFLGFGVGGAFSMTLKLQPADSNE